MFRRLRQSKGFKVATYLTGMLQFAFPPYAIAQSNGPQIVIDGRTSTSLITNQNVTNVYTSTVLGSTGFNSFSIFNVYDGNEVNLFLPDGASSLMNMVHDQQTVIDGYLNSYKDGKIGGDVYFLNPHGIIVGKTGVLRAVTGDKVCDLAAQWALTKIFLSKSIIHYLPPRRSRR